MPFGIDIDLEEVSREINRMVSDFSTSYMTRFQVALTKKILDDSFEEKKGEPEARQLKQAPPPPVPDKKGELKTKSAILGRWKTRHFFIKDNYELGYSSSADGKEDGAYNLWGYKVQSLTQKPEGPRKGGPDWIPDEDRPQCKACKKEFSQIIWHHHCRACGEVFCGSCSDNKVPLTHFGYDTPQRVCDTCYYSSSRTRSTTFTVKQPKEEKADAQFHGIYLLHINRTPYILECANLQEKKEWIDALTECCKKAAIPVNPDPVQAAAFRDAYQAFAWNLSYYYSFRITGTESEMLGEIMARAVNERIIRPAFDNADASIPASVKKMAATTVNGQVRKLVVAAVGPAWKAIVAKVSENQKAVEDQVRKVIDPIANAKKAAKEALLQKVAEIINPALDKAGQQVLDKVFELAGLPIAQHFGSMFKLLHKEITEGAAKCADRKAFETFITTTTRAFRGSSGTLKPVHSAVAELNNAIKHQQSEHEFLKYFPVTKTLDDLLDRLHNLVEQTLFTLHEEPGTAQANPQAVKDAWVVVQAKLVHDSQIDVIDLISTMLQDSAFGAVQEHVLQNEQLKDILAPIDEQVPETVRPYLTASGMLEEIVLGAVGGAVSRVVDASSASLKGEISQSMAALH